MGGIYNYRLFCSPINGATMSYRSQVDCIIFDMLQTEPIAIYNYIFALQKIGCIFVVFAVIIDETFL